MARFTLTTDEMAKLLGVSMGNIQCRHKQTQLSPAISDRLFLVARIVSEATETLGNEEKAVRWLHKTNRTLGRDTPLSRLDTSIGIQQLKEVLMCIEHGIFA